MLSEKKSFLSVIPARGGSKRLPHKNLLNLDGKPLIAWTIEAGLKSSYIDKVVVASDNNEILKISAEYGASTLMLPDILASDNANIYSAIKYVIEQNEAYDYIVLLQPTSPLRTADHIDEAIHFLSCKSADAVISVCETEHNPLWANKLPKNQSLKNFLREDVVNKKSQELPTYYRLNGAIYICDTKLFLKKKTFFIQEKIYAYKMNRENSVDIDHPIDLKLASFLKQINL
jgi:CMP-N,N'-diacetyllegionaminic acid synthase